MFQNLINKYDFPGPSFKPREVSIRNAVQMVCPEIEIRRSHVHLGQNAGGEKYKQLDSLINVKQIKKSNTYLKYFLAYNF